MCDEGDHATENKWPVAQAPTTRLVSVFVVVFVGCVGLVVV